MVHSNEIGMEDQSVEVLSALALKGHRFNFWGGVFLFILSAPFSFLIIGIPGTLISVWLMISSHIKIRRIKRNIKNGEVPDEIKRMKMLGSAMSDVMRLKTN